MRGGVDVEWCGGGSREAAVDAVEGLLFSCVEGGIVKRDGAVRRSWEKGVEEALIKGCSCTMGTRLGSARAHSGYGKVFLGWGFAVNSVQGSKFRAWFGGLDGLGLGSGWLRSVEWTTG